MADSRCASLLVHLLVAILLSSPSLTSPHSTPLLPHPLIPHFLGTHYHCTSPYYFLSLAVDLYSPTSALRRTLFRPEQNCKNSAILSVFL